jgi:hypothetical protein
VYCSGESVVLSVFACKQWYNKRIYYAVPYTHSTPLDDHQCCCCHTAHNAALVAVLAQFNIACISLISAVLTDSSEIGSIMPCGKLGALAYISIVFTLRALFVAATDICVAQ